MGEDVFSEPFLQLEQFVESFKGSDKFNPDFLSELMSLLTDFQSFLASARVPTPEEMKSGEQIWDDLAVQIENMGKPDPLPFGVSPRGAEKYVAEWLTYLGIEVIDLTPTSRDGGYDLESDEYLIEVKNWQKNWLPVSAVREIYGVSQLHGKTAMVFSSGFLSEDASEFAEKAEIPVFLFNAEEAILEPHSSAARELLERSMSHKYGVGLATYYQLVGKLLVNYFLQSLDVYANGARAYQDKFEKLPLATPDLVDRLQKYNQGLEDGLGVMKRKITSIMEIDLLQGKTVHPRNVLRAFVHKEFKKAEIVRDFIRTAVDAISKNIATDGT